ncbi:MAG: AraC family transcriptional regulator [Ruminococcaceae bacterium]|nr:AraC family transcriptional regulator [Oscillospiraceae bacterium]
MPQTFIDLWEGDLCFQHKLDVAPPLDYMSTHTHNCYELLYIIDGNITHVVEDKKYKLNSGDLVFVRPNMYHFIQIDSSSKDYERINIQFDESDINTDMSIIPPSINVINTANNSRLSDIFAKINVYSETFDKEVFFKILRGLITEIVYNISLTESADMREELSVTNPLMTKAIAYINNNLFTIKNVSEIADAVFVTESYLFKLFKKELRKGPKKYITDKRLLAAQRMIKNGEKPTTVFEKCGFNDYTSFYRGYVECFGHSPSQEAINDTKNP